MEDKLIKKEYFVKGMHCSACELFVEKNISEIPGIKNAEVNLSKETLNITSIKEFSADELTEYIKDGGYSIFEEKLSPTKQNSKELLTAFLIALGVMLIFLLLQKLDIINLVNTDKISLPFVFLIGITASLSTCMAVIGGLVLSISSSLSKEKNFKPLMSFHIARLIGFFILGGVIGLIGSAFIITPIMSLVLNIILFFVMLVMVLNLLEISPRIAKFQIKMPKIFGKKVLENKNYSIWGTALLGVMTFILPCGFTQSMQIYSLSTGSFLSGALTMFVFALGTFPVLSLISFASYKFSKTMKSKLFFKVAGFIVILFALFNLYNSLVGTGIFL